MPKVKRKDPIDPQILINKIISLELFQPFVKEWVSRKSSNINFLSNNNSMSSQDSDLMFDSSHEESRHALIIPNLPSHKNVEKKKVRYEVEGT